jgi:rRNA maturation endonuclease Nob1
MAIKVIEDNDSLSQRGETAWVIPCWLCDSLIPVKFTKKNKAYLICDNCGTQTFIRYGRAEDLLIAKIKQCREGK